jgi:hypothetical protein
MPPPPREVDSPTPITTGCRGGCGVGTRGVRGGTRHRVFSGGAREHRGSAGERHGGTVRRDSDAPEPSRKRKQGFSNLR